MPLTTNTAPYFDDFDASKEFYKILFRPGYALQARELTQLQSIQQEQLNRFGQHIFANGAQVIPGGITYDQNLAYVKLLSTYSSAVVNYDLIDPLVVGSNVLVKGVTTGVVAQVVQVARNINTLYVKYVSSGTNNTTAVFANNEVLEIHPADSVSVCQLISSSATGITASASIADGVYFIYGKFLNVLSQTIRLADYNQLPSVKVGLRAIETIVTPEDDPSLNDNALGSPNYAAPGAHRYKIVLALTVLDINADADNSFTELMRVDSGNIQSQVQVTDYSVINDTLARRTFDANGNFITTPFQFDLHENLLDVGGTNGGIYTFGQGGVETKLALGIEPGKAYVQGYEIQTISKQFINLDKARTTNYFQNSHTRAYLGNYVFINHLFGLPNYHTCPQVTLYGVPNVTPGTTPGTAIGTATIRGLEFYAGTFGTTTDPGPIFKCYLTDINITTANKTVTDIRSLSVNDGTLTTTADVLSQVDIVNVVGTFTTGSTITGGGHTETVYAWDTNNNLLLTLPATTSIPVNTPITASVVGSGTANILQRITLFDTVDNILVYQLPQKMVSTVRDLNNALATTYSYRKVFAAASVVSGAVTFTTDTNEVFASVDVEDYVANVETGTASGKLIDVTAASPTFAPGLTVITFNTPGGATSVKLSATVVKSLVSEKAKILNVNQALTVTAPTSVINIGRADIFAIEGIWTGTDETGTDVTSWYKLDNGQRDNLYDLGTLTLKPGYTSPSSVYIKFQYFSHGSGIYFCVNSYSNFITNWYSLIPYFYGSNGSVYSLRDCLDFRPRADDSGFNTTGNGVVPSPPVYASTTINPLVKPNDDVVTDFSYYLARVDKLYLSAQGFFEVIKGTPALFPLAPADPAVGMVLAILTYPAFTVSPKLVKIQIIPNKVYTMAKLGYLEQRISNLEYYSALNLLEQNTANMQIPDATTGLNRYQSGFVVDNFINNSVSDYTNPDIHFSIDVLNNIMRPTYNTNSVGMSYDSAQSSNIEFRSLKPNNSILTLPYTESPLVVQSTASRIENINPYNVFQFIGTMALNPTTDSWVSVTYLPDITIINDSAYDAMRSQVNSENVLGTVWNAWTTDWTGLPDTAYNNPRLSGFDPGVNIAGNPNVYDAPVDWEESGGLSGQLTRQAVTTTTIGQSRTGRQTLVVNVPTKTVNDVQVNTGMVPYCRANAIYFVAQGLKPSTQFWAFFDITNVTSNCVPSSLVSDASGMVSGVFNLPDPTTSLNFRTGSRIFKLCNDPNNVSANITSFATATYTASGVLDTNQRTITSVGVPEIQTQTISDTRTINQTTQTSVTTNVWMDPLAQSFLVGTLTGGYCATSIDVYFQGKDANIPVTLQIREMLNGTPTQSVVPFSTVVLNPSSVNISPTASSATNFAFTSPVYLKQNAEYAIVLMANSNNYWVWTALMGDYELNTDILISQVPYTGLLFKSQNASTWVPSPAEALKFTLYRATFNYGVLGNAILENPVLPIKSLPDLSVITYDTVNTIRIIHPNHGMPATSKVTITIPPGTANANWAASFNGIAVNLIVPTTSGTLRTSSWASGVADPNMLYATVGNITGLFSINDIVSDNTSSATGVVVGYTTNLVQILVTSGTFGNHAITDTTSGATATISAIAVGGSRTYSIDNVELDSYTISILNASAVAVNATSSGLTGVALTVTENYAYDIMMPIVNELNFSGTNTNYYMRAITEKSIHGTALQVPYNRTVSGDVPSVQFIPNQNLVLTAPQMVASLVNETYLINRGYAYLNKSLVWKIDLSSTSDNLSPMVDLTRCTALLVNNRIDYRVSNTIVLASVTSGPFKINEIVTTPATAFKGIVLEYNATTKTLVVAPLSGTAAVGATLTGTDSTAHGAISSVIGENGIQKYNTETIPDLATPAYISERDSHGETDEAVFITLPVVLQNTANSIHFWLNTMLPYGSQVDVYYKILPTNTNATFNSQNYVLMAPDPNTDFSPAQNASDFRDYYWFADYIGDFTTFAVKIVMRSTNSSAVPLCRQLRAIALET